MLIKETLLLLDTECEINVKTCVYSENFKQMKTSYNVCLWPQTTRNLAVIVEFSTISAI